MGEQLEDENLLLHKSEDICGPTAMLGSRVDGERLTLEIADERLFKVQAGVQGLLSRRRVTGWSVEVTAGHLTFCGLANRGLLTVLQTVYRFMHRH